MNWFRHDTQASMDPKIKRLIARHGAEGYAVYFHCLELISMSVSENHLTFELEHDAEIIMDNLKIKGDGQFSGVDRVNAMMRTIVELGLFQSVENRIVCLQLAKRITAAQIKNPRLKGVQEVLRLAGPSAVLKSSLKITEETAPELQEPQVDTPQGNNDSSLKITEKVEFFTVEETRREEKFNTTRGENPELVDNSGESGEPQAHHQLTKAETIELLDLWKSHTSLPQYRGDITTLKTRDAIRAHCKLYTQAERIQALNNLARIKADPVAFGNLWPDYLDPESFLRGGIAKYIDEAKPFERCMSKAAKSNKAPSVSKPKVKLYCKHCGTEKAASYCVNRNCKANNLDGYTEEWVTADKVAK